jgi:hypothetical protein
MVQIYKDFPLFANISFIFVDILNIFKYKPLFCPVFLLIFRLKDNLKTIVKTKEKARVAIHHGHTLAHNS